ncbi:hypothetical protein [Parabacteroides goldsteinii]|uniref:hypothetical protein n=1 Tax=Parabacteroides goldsteinii TaxID=328812 RepID=UPI0025B679C3|nr:hypothetical protein [Parabacteroides goldsteinii]
MASRPSSQASCIRNVGHTMPSEKIVWIWKSHFNRLYPSISGNRISLRAFTRSFPAFICLGSASCAWLHTLTAMNDKAINTFVVFIYSCF